MALFVFLGAYINLLPLALKSLRYFDDLLVLVGLVLAIRGRICLNIAIVEEVYLMANTKSAKKAVRKIATKTEVNKARRSRMRTFIRKVEEAIAAGDQSAAQLALKAAQPEIVRGANKGVIHKNTASRKVSRLSQRIKAMA